MASQTCWARDLIWISRTQLVVGYLEVPLAVVHVGHPAVPVTWTQDSRQNLPPLVHAHVIPIHNRINQWGRFDSRQLPQQDPHSAPAPYSSGCPTEKHTASTLSYRAYFHLLTQKSSAMSTVILSSNWPSLCFNAHERWEDYVVCTSRKSLLWWRLHLRDVSPIPLRVAPTK